MFPSLSKVFVLEVATHAFIVIKSSQFKQFACIGVPVYKYQNPCLQVLYLYIGIVLVCKVLSNCSNYQDQDFQSRPRQAKVRELVKMYPN